MTVVDFLRLSRANWHVLLVAIVVCTLGAYAYVLSLPVTYASSSSAFVQVGGTGNIADTINGSQVAQQKAQAYTTLVGTLPVANEVSKATGIPVGRIAGHITASVGTAALITVSVTCDTPSDCPKIANAALVATANTVKNLESDGGQTVIRVVPLQNATGDGGRISPNVKKHVEAGFAAGVVLGYLLAVLRLMLDQRLRTVQDVETITGAGTLGILPKTSMLRGNSRRDADPHSHAGEALRQLRTNLRFVNVDNPPKAIVVTSPNPGEGKSTVASTLARVLADAGTPTVLIDADLRRPTVAEVYGIDGSVGLSQVLAGTVELEDALRSVSTENLRILPAGRVPPNPSELVGSDRMRSLLSTLREDHMVIIDAPPILPVTDAGLLAAAADGAVLVAVMGRTAKEQLRVSVSMLERINARLLGSVINRAPARGIGAAYYGYGYGGYRRASQRYYSSEVTEPKQQTESTPDVDAATGAVDGGASVSSRSERHVHLKRRAKV
ncbi:polysaccharide biosynthesis tyrosine autokinase [Allobranchiibius sp. GilTou73]|uniref:polysaccharide biosynthesis tyrosine autokinase n=1 Tax=Allobranchiibius sp. GilTou73 TaxID=2904523 RepID=UPI001F2F1A9B|nr:polysaccharide biosynthesis tyrosine autokinase [Allobranchiibius sp. GilTou73]UIJ33483.1 polysaccharide biosynthesis tyrosine autokinase [Allobranchiibius sp. GilTou73]